MFNPQAEPPQAIRRFVKTPTGTPCIGLPNLSQEAGRADSHPYPESPRLKHTMEPPRLVIYDHDPSPDRFRLGWRHVQLHGLWWRPSEVASAFEGLFAKFPDPSLPFGEMRRPWVFMSIDASAATVRSTAEIPLAITFARIARCGQARVALVGLSERVETVVLRLLTRWRSPAIFDPIFLPPSFSIERN
jgi:hypothetical protein